MSLIVLGRNRDTTNQRWGSLGGQYGANAKSNVEQHDRAGSKDALSGGFRHCAVGGIAFRSRSGVRPSVDGQRYDIGVCHDHCARDEIPAPPAAGQHLQERF